jgi:outer membrane protein OmpA-like peptidoglycan-associated protein
MDVSRRVRGLVVSVILALSGCSSVDLTDLVSEGLRLRGNGRFEEAAALWIEATRMDPGFCTAYIDAVESYRRGKRSLEAVAILDNAGPCREDPEVLLVSALLRLEAQDYLGAKSELEILARREPDVPEHYVRLGDVSKAQGDLGGARRYYEMAQMRGEGNPLVELALARLMAAEGNREGAIAGIEAASHAGLRPDVIGSDPGLAMIRSDPRIVALTQSMGGQGAPTVVASWTKFKAILFDFDKSDIASNETSKVADIATYVQQNPSTMVAIDGYADRPGTDQYNQILSERRVNAIRDALLRAGVAPHRIQTGAFGELRLKCPESTEGCWEADRRVEVLISPVAGK